METPEPAPPRDPLPRVELKTERLLLRPWREEDIPGVFAICQDPAIQRWTTVPSPYRLGDAEAFVRDIVPKGIADGTDMVFGLFVRDSGSIAGAVGLHGITKGSAYGPARSRQGEIGFWANPETRNHGYVTEAVREVVRWGFDEMGLQRLQWQAYRGNEASWRVAEKVGFTMTGVQRAFAIQRGKLVDMVLADMLPSDPRL